MQTNPYNLETLVLGDSPVQKTPSTPVRILAFTCTAMRPYYIRCCVLQIQQQTYPVDHVIYINHPEAADRSDLYNYISLLNDLAPQHGTLTIRYGLTGTQQLNHIKALELADLDHYDLFLKIDDDDVYRRGYVQDVAADYLEHRWDFSGTHARGVIDGAKWGPNNVCRDLGMEARDIELGVAGMMPSSYAFSRKALDAIRVIPTSIDKNEDILWRRSLTENEQIKKHVRKRSGMAYHLHGSNISAWVSFEKTL